MKRIIAILLAATMTVSLAACAKSEASAETETATEAATEAATEVAEEEDEPEEIARLKDALYGADPDRYTDGGEYMDSTAYYIDKNEIADIATFVTPMNGITLEEFMSEKAEEKGGCYDITEKDGIKYALHSTYAILNDTPVMKTTCTAEYNDIFYAKQYIKHLNEIQMGDSSTCFYLPKTMEAVNDEFEEELFGPHLLGKYKDNGYSGMTVSVYEFDADGFKYDAEKAVFEAYGYPMVEEEFFEELAKDGFTAEEVAKYYKKLYGSKVVEEAEMKAGNVTEQLFEVAFDNDGTEYTGVYVVWVEEGKIREIYMEGPTDTWMSMGKAIAMSVHKKSGSIDISLGGNCGNLKLGGPAYGEYEEIPAEGWFEYPEAKESHVYADTSCDTPYLAFYRIDKNGQTLEEYTAAEKEFFGAKKYVMASSEPYESIPSDQIGYICSSASFDEEYYYIDVFNFEDGEDFVQIVWVSKSQEVVLGDSGKAIYVPAGEYSAVTDEGKAHGGIFWGVYDDSYYKPTVWVAKFDPTYENAAWFWGKYYPEGVPFTEEEFNEALDSLPDSVKDSNGAYEKYYGLFGYETLKLDETSKNDVDISLAIIKSEEFNKKCYHIVLDIDDEYYEVWTSCELRDDAPYIAHGIVNSIHDVK